MKYGWGKQFSCELGEIIQLHDGNKHDLSFLIEIEIASVSLECVFLRGMSELKTVAQGCRFWLKSGLGQNHRSQNLLNFPKM